MPLQKFLPFLRKSVGLPGVTLPALYDPLRLAEQVAMLGRITSGRMHFGAAIGYRERELEALGVSMVVRMFVRY